MHGWIPLGGSVKYTFWGKSTLLRVMLYRPIACTLIFDFFIPDFPLGGTAPGLHVKVNLLVVGSTQPVTQPVKHVV